MDIGKMNLMAGGWSFSLGIFGLRFDVPKLGSDSIVGGFLVRYLLSKEYFCSVDCCEKAWLEQASP